MRGFGLAMALGAVLTAAVPVAAQDVIPERRAIYLDDADLPGGDIASLFDTSVDACERACIANTRCEALTYNSRNGSCFLKAAPGEAAFYQGAFSARIVDTDPAAIARAETRAAELAFLSRFDLDRALVQAAGLGGLHITGDFTVEEHLASAAQAEAGRDPGVAATYLGAIVNVTDDPAHWAEYARLLRAEAARDGNLRSDREQRALNALINAYLRADAPAQRHTILADMGAVLEQVGRGRDTVQALRLAQDLQPRDDTAVALDDAIGKYGFRITENEVQSDLARPRMCAVFSEDLARSGVDYATFVQLPEPGLVV
ncbi:MAG TPA: PAN domain-containing protein, partial [Paracoccaceae bacterium]|nr:PAN domain-containing protein [Paracoccaceae bacterium]